MTYSVVNPVFYPPIGVLTGSLVSTSSADPLGGIIVSAYDGNAGYVAQVRTLGGGNFSMSLASLSAGSHNVLLTADYGAPIAAVPIRSGLGGSLVGAKIAGSA